MIPDALKSGATRFDLKAAAFLAEMSRLAYAPETEIVKWIALSRNQCGYVPVSVANHQAVLFAFEEIVVVAFRGTEKDYEDILTDLDIDKVRFVPGCNFEVHDGFNSAADALLPTIRNLLDEHCPAGCRSLYFTGHSLGGALAQLCAAKLSKSGAVVYSFGSPRVGDAALASTLEKFNIHHRIVNASDIVPNLPPKTMGFKLAGHGITSPRPVIFSSSRAFGGS